MIKKLTHKQIKRLADGAAPESVIKERFDWSGLIRSMAKEIIRQKSLRFDEDK